jgi:hypothetical protein
MSVVRGLANDTARKVDTATSWPHRGHTSYRTGPQTAVSRRKRAEASPGTNPASSAGFRRIKRTGQGGLEPPTSGFGDNRLACGDAIAEPKSDDGGGRGHTNGHTSGSVTPATLVLALGAARASSPGKTYN